MILQFGWKGGRGSESLVWRRGTAARIGAGTAARAGSVWNVYGPTETTIWSTLERVRNAERLTGSSRPSDREHAGLRIDGNLEPVPVGIPGELLSVDGSRQSYQAEASLN